MKWKTIQCCTFSELLESSLNFFSSQTGSIILQYLSVLQRGQMHQIWKKHKLYGYRNNFLEYFRCTFPQLHIKVGIAVSNLVLTMTEDVEAWKWCVVWCGVVWCGMVRDSEVIVNPQEPTPSLFCTAMQCLLEQHQTMMSFWMFD